jgi:hypothetical protein
MYFLEYDAATSDDLLCIVRGAISGFACLINKDPNHRGSPEYAEASRNQGGHIEYRSIHIVHAASRTVFADGTAAPFYLKISIFPGVHLSYVDEKRYEEAQMSASAIVGASVYSACNHIM